MVFNLKEKFEVSNTDYNSAPQLLEFFNLNKSKFNIQVWFKYMKLQESCK